MGALESIAEKTSQIQAEPLTEVPALRATNLSCGYNSISVLDNINFTMSGTRPLALLGPNGVGKTTLFKTLLGFLAPCAGHMEICGRDTGSWTRRDFARQVAYIPQLHTPSFSFLVEDVVVMGRTPYLDAFRGPAAHDVQIAQECLCRLGIEHLAHRDYSALSGGERQMVLIARALAQQPRMLVMDEPCASLDFGNQARLLEQLLELSEQGMAIIMTTHDPNHAFLLDGDVLCLGHDDKGAGERSYNNRSAGRPNRVTAYGPAREVLDAVVMHKLYGVPVAVNEVRFRHEGSEGATAVACVPFIASSKGAKKRMSQNI